MKLPRSWLLPDDEPIVSLLNDQWLTVAGTLEQVAAWASEGADLEALVITVKQARRIERDQRRTLHLRVREAFSTPLDAEDIYELGERISMLHRQLYLLVREAEVTNTTPDEGLAGIISAVARAAQPLSSALAGLPKGSAADDADAAAELLETADRAYRTALKHLDHADVRVEILHRELYRRAEQVSDAAMRIAHRVWYAICKAG